MFMVLARSGRPLPDIHHLGDPNAYTPNAFSVGADGFSGDHPAAVNFAFADGSVRGLRNSIAPPTFSALTSRGGGEAISAESY